PFSCTTLTASRRLAPALIGQLLDPATHRRRANPKRLASLGDAHALIEHLARGLDFELRRKISSAHLIPRSGWCSNPNRVSEIIEPLQIAVVDGLKGFPEAITAVFPDTVV